MAGDHGSPGGGWGSWVEVVVPWSSSSWQQCGVELLNNRQPDRMCNIKRCEIDRVVLFFCLFVELFKWHMAS